MPVSLPSSRGFDQWGSSPPCQFSLELRFSRSPSTSGGDGPQFEQSTECSIARISGATAVADRARRSPGHGLPSGLLGDACPRSAQCATTGPRSHDGCTPSGVEARAGAGRERVGLEVERPPQQVPTRRWRAVVPQDPTEDAPRPRPLSPAASSQRPSAAIGVGSRLGEASEPCGRRSGCRDSNPGARSLRQSTRRSARRTARNGTGKPCPATTARFGRFGLRPPRPGSPGRRGSRRICALTVRGEVVRGPTR